MLGKVTEWGPPPPLPDDIRDLPHFDKFVAHCMLLPPGVRSMTYGEFCQDVSEGLR